MSAKARSCRHSCCQTGSYLTVDGSEGEFNRQSVVGGLPTPIRDASPGGCHKWSVGMFTVGCYGN